jgi:predicted nucleic acid-binding protein
LKTLEAAEIEGESVVVSDLVVAEAFHVLRHHYGTPEALVRARLVDFLRSGVVEPDPPAMLAAFDSAAGAGLVDRLIHSRYQVLGATTLTFDREQGRIEGARLVE